MTKLHVITGDQTMAGDSHVADTAHEGAASESDGHLPGGNMTSGLCVPHAGWDISHDPTHIGMFIVTALSFGIFFRVILRQYVVLSHLLPYTILLLIFGLALGALADAVSLAGLSYSIEVWLEIPPETLLFMFIPPLLFSSTIVIDWHVFRRLSAQALLLATVGVLISMVLIAVVGAYVFGYGWSFLEALMFGAMFSATDPVGT